MKDLIDQIVNSACKEIKIINDSRSLEEFRVKFLGKKSELQNLLKKIGTLSKEEKPVIGQALNKAKKTIYELFNNLKNGLEISEQDSKLKSELFDLTLPGVKVPIGHKHIISKSIEEICDIFINLGFEVKIGPELETDFHNFEALNIP
ncbi:phenylalanine--tRNA ligase subunit alpha, partial [Candidatus Dependentiae bacterium]|nr:phenylalanine--tRNA ligase subunit alpha [Candidatus Dependentiae bacterium]